MSRTSTLNRLGLGALIGITIGTTIELIFSAATSTAYTPGTPAFLEQFANANVAVFIERVLYAALGVIGSVTSLVYASERLSLTAATLIHGLCTGAAVLVVGLVLRWFPLG